MTHLVLDLDPPDTDAFSMAVGAAHLVRQALADVGLVGAVKTSGAKGVHVFVPIDDQAPPEDAAAETKKKIADIMAQVNLTGLEQRYPNELSGGQQQRVALARSLVVEPGILLLDEPLSNLDAKLREHMRGELKQLQRRTGITFVYVTHDQAEALALSDMIAVIHGGKLQQYGTPHEVYARPANRIVADFMGLVNLVPGKVTAAIGGSRDDRGGRGLEAAGDRRPSGIGTGDNVEVVDPPREHPHRQPGPVAGAAACAPRSPSARFSATSASTMRASTPVRRFGYRPIRRRCSPSATMSRSRSTPRNAVCFAAIHRSEP